MIILKCLSLNDKCRRTSGPYPTQRSTMKAVRFHLCGGPEVLTYEDVPAPTPGPGEAAVEIKAIGLNYIDTYHREGLYPVELPCIPGMEAAGVVAGVGEGVEGVQVGDRVAYAGGDGVIRGRSGCNPPTAWFRCLIQRPIRWGPPLCYKA